MRLVDVPVRMTHLWRWRDEQMVLFSEATFNVRRFDLNPVGGTAWELADGERTVADIATEVSKRFPGESQEAVQAMLVQFFAELESEWLVHTRESLAGYG